MIPRVHLVVEAASDVATMTMMLASSQLWCLMWSCGIVDRASREPRRLHDYRPVCEASNMTLLAMTLVSASVKVVSSGRVVGRNESWYRRLCASTYPITLVIDNAIPSVPMVRYLLGLWYQYLCLVVG